MEVNYETLVTVEEEPGKPGEPVTLGHIFETSYLELEEKEEIVNGLATKGEYLFGGGAAAEVWLRLAG